MIELGSEKVSVIVSYNGEEILFHCRKPKASEKIKYRSNIFQIMKKNDNVEETWAFTIDFVSNFIEGFEDNKILYNGKVISSDTNSVNYEPNWKNVLKEEVPEILDKIAEYLFAINQVELKLPFGKS